MHKNSDNKTAEMQSWEVSPSVVNVLRIRTEFFISPPDLFDLFAVFDDGDENTLRRSQLCPKGEKHFVQSEVGELLKNQTLY